MSPRPGSAASCASAGPAASPCPATQPQTWTNATCGYLQLPAARSGASFAYDPADGYALLFGGRSPSGLLNDTWTYSNHSWRDVSASAMAAPPAREGSSLAYDSVGHFFLLFGGRTATRTLGDTWEFANGRWTNVTAGSTYAPTPRAGASMAFDRKTEYVVLFGGRAGGLTYSETWSFARGNWTHLFPGNHPAPRSNATFLYASGLFTPAGLLLFGGLNLTGAALNDTWEYQAGAWKDVTLSSGAAPPARSDSAAADDLLDNEVVLFGGADRSGGLLGDTWTFNATGWSQVASSSAAGAIAGGSMVYLVTSTKTTTDGYTLLQGGRLAGGALSSACWKFGALVAHPTIGPADVGQNDSASVYAVRGVPPYQYHWSFGDGVGSNYAQTNHSFWTPGTILVNVTATDQIGVVSLVGLHVPIAPTLAVNATTNRSQTDIGIAVNFSARPSGGLPPYQLSWSFSQGASSKLASVAHAFVTAGLQRGVVVVTDANNFTVIQGVNLSVHPLLRAAPALNATGLILIGQSVAFKANISGGTTPYRVTWNVDGTNASSGLVLNYTFPFTGPHVVSVYVHDLAGASAVGQLNLTVAGTPTTTSAPKTGFWTATHAAEVGVGIGLVLLLVVALIVRSRRRGPPEPPASSTRTTAPPPRVAGGSGGGSRAGPAPSPGRPGTGSSVRGPPVRPVSPPPARPGNSPPRTPPSGAQSAPVTDPLFTWTSRSLPGRSAPALSPAPPSPRPGPIVPAPPDPAFRVRAPATTPSSPALPRTMSVLNSRPPPAAGSTPPTSPSLSNTLVSPKDPLQRPKRPAP